MKYFVTKALKIKAMNAGKAGIALSDALVSIGNSKCVKASYIARKLNSNAERNIRMISSK
jgi:hypothetical protein